MKHEKTLERMTYLLCIIIFTNLSLMNGGIDYTPLIIMGIICVLMMYGMYIFRRYYPMGDKFILNFIIVFSIIGIGMIYRINSSEAIKQIIWFTIGTSLFIFIMIVFNSLSKFYRYKYIYMVGTIVFMSMGFLIGTEKLGSKNWVSIEGITFQPSELGKILLVLYLASALRRYTNIKDVIMPGIVMGISLGFMLLQKDLGSGLIFFGMFVAMIYIATGKKRYPLISLPIFMIGSVIGYKLFAHVRLRVMIWQDPWPYANNESLQVVQSLYAIASGGLFGVGMGKGYPEFIPIVSSDLIFAPICEELGMLTGFAIIILYFLLYYRCMRTAIYVKDGFLRLVSVGFSTMIVMQAIVMIGGSTGMLPLTGITLPFISYGGTSVITMFFSLGIIQKISEEERVNG